MIKAGRKNEGGEMMKEGHVKGEENDWNEKREGRRGGKNDEFIYSSQFCV